MNQHVGGRIRSYTINSGLELDRGNQKMTLTAGTKLCRYQIRSKLGDGGTAKCIWQAIRDFNAAWL